MRKLILLLVISLSALCSAAAGGTVSASYTTAAYRVSVQNDVFYGEAEGFWTSYPDTGEDFKTVYANKVGELVRGRSMLSLTMDIYSPEGDSSACRPLLVFAHGGAFFNGDKATEPIVRWCRYFASLGYVVASVNYRIGFRPTPGAILDAAYCACQDVEAAIRFLVYHRAEFRIDPMRVFLAGSSAGGITALNVAFMKERDWPESVSLQEGINPWMDEPYRVLAVANLWGAVRDLGVLSNAGTAVISFHARRDPVVPFAYGRPFQQLSFLKNILFDRMYGSELIHDELRGQPGRSSELYVYELDEHDLYYDGEGRISPRVDGMMQRTAAFFSSQML